MVGTGNYSGLTKTMSTHRPVLSIRYYQFTWTLRFLSCPFLHQDSALHSNLHSQTLIAKWKL